MPRGTGRSTALRQGDTFAGEVRDLTSSGLGVVAHESGRVFFVPGVWQGERGKFVVSALRGRSGEAQLLELEHASPQRSTPPCVHHGVDDNACGGCPWMFMDYPAQLRAKEQRVARAFSNHGDAHISPIWPSEQQLGYRNRAQLKTDGRRLGFVAARSRRLKDIDDCLVLNAHNRQTLQALRGELPRRDWKPPRGRGWSTLHIDDAIGADEVVLNQRRPFRQGNSAQNQRMRQWLGEVIDSLGAPSPVLELFAGSGNFTDVLVARSFSNIHAVDSFEPAVAALQERALPGVQAICHDLHRPRAAAAMGAALEHAKLLVLDPPREGLKTLDEFIAAAPKLEHLLYVSCDVATCARDVQLAVAQGFRLRSVQPLDLFPHTPHVELLCQLERTVC